MTGRLGNPLQSADRRLRAAPFQSGDIALIGFEPFRQLRLREVGGGARAQDRGSYRIAAR